MRLRRVRTPANLLKTFQTLKPLRRGVRYAGTGGHDELSGFYSISKWSVI